MEGPVLSSDCENHGGRRETTKVLNVNGFPTYSCLPPSFVGLVEFLVGTSSSSSNAVRQSVHILRPHRGPDDSLSTFPTKMKCSDSYPTEVDEKREVRGTCHRDAMDSQSNLSSLKSRNNGIHKNSFPTPK